MLILAVMIAITPGELEGFWHSEPDLSDGYGSCYFFWEDGGYAFLRSLNEGIVYTGSWELTSGNLVLRRSGARRLDGTPVDMGMREISMALTEPRGKPGRIFLDGDVFYQLASEPEQEIYSVIPTWGMTSDESSAFSTYD